MQRATVPQQLHQPQPQNSAALLAALLERRSVSPRRLGMPGPTPDQLEQMVQAGLRAPDHGGLLPWRLIEFGPAQRGPLAELFAQEKQRRTAQPSAQDLERAKAHATDAPVLLAFVVCIRNSGDVPAHEQWLSAGAALGNLLNAAHAMGFGAIVLSGERCRDGLLARQLGVQDQDGEQLVGFISVGTILKPPPPRNGVEPQRCWTQWPGTAPC